jgi:hypothetical protein
MKGCNRCPEHLSPPTPHTPRSAGVPRELTLPPTPPPPHPLALQVYPENSVQAEMMVGAAMKSGFSGGLVVDFPHSTRAKKYYLCLMVGSTYYTPQVGGDAPHVPHGGVSLPHAPGGWRHPLLRCLTPGTQLRLACCPPFVRGAASNALVLHSPALYPGYLNLPVLCHVRRPEG